MRAFRTQAKNRHRGTFNSLGKFIAPTTTAISLHASTNKTLAAPTNARLALAAKVPKPALATKSQQCESDMNTFPVLSHNYVHCYTQGHRYLIQEG